MPKKYPLISLFVLIGGAVLAMHSGALAAPTLAKTLSGKILLQVESHGEAWYLNPGDLKRYYLGRPEDAFSLMRSLGVGITNADLSQIATGNIDEIGLTHGTASSSLISRLNIGKIFLQVESHGEAWYVNPSDFKRYYLGRPADAFAVMKKLGLGITNQNLSLISIGYVKTSMNTPAPVDAGTASSTVAQDDFYKAAQAIMAGRREEALSYFTDDMQTSVKYTMDFLDAEGRFNFGNMLAGARLSSSNENEKIYSTTVSYAGYTKTINFHVKKQSDGKWLIANLQ